MGSRFRRPNDGIWVRRTFLCLGSFHQIHNMNESFAYQYFIFSPVTTLGDVDDDLRSPLAIKFSTLPWALHLLHNQLVIRCILHYSSKFCVLFISRMTLLAYTKACSKGTDAKLRRGDDLRVPYVTLVCISNTMKKRTISNAYQIPPAVMVNEEN